MPPPVEQLPRLTVLATAAYGHAFFPHAFARAYGSSEPWYLHVLAPDPHRARPFQSFEPYLPHRLRVPEQLQDRPPTRHRAPWLHGGAENAHRGRTEHEPPVHPVL